MPFAIAADISGIINIVSNAGQINNFGQGLAFYGLGAASGTLSAVNPLLGATLGNAITSGGNNLIHQYNEFGSIDWGKAGIQASIGTVAGLVSFGTLKGLEKYGITDKLLDVTGIKNSLTREIVGKTINGTISGAAEGLINGVGLGISTGEWNVWKYTLRHAAIGAVTGFATSSLKHLGVKWNDNRNRPEPSPLDLNKAPVLDAPQPTPTFPIFQMPTIPQFPTRIYIQPYLPPTMTEIPVWYR